MARQKGLIKFSGTIDGINFYFRKGEAVARKAGGGFTSKSVKHSPAMVRTRENSKEFGHVSKFKRLFRIGLFPFLNGFADTSLHGRLMSLFQAIKGFDVVSARGERSLGIALATLEGQRMLEQFAFTEKRLKQVLRGKVVFEPLDATLSVSDFTIAQMIFPHQATVAEVLFGVLRFDTNVMETQLFMSPPVWLTKDAVIADFSMTTTAPVVGQGIFMAVVSVRFYEEVNGERYLLKDLESQCVEILGVW